jgi:hypothetical protein
MMEFNECIKRLQEAQEADHDNREEVREAQLFLHKKDGQWEPTWWSANVGKPRYTFDMTNPIVDQISGELMRADFDIKIRPAGGDATKDVSMLYDGIIRNIENISGASNIFNAAAKRMIGTGIDGWRVAQRYVDADSFDQDIVIEPVHNFIDRVWCDKSSEAPDWSDAKWCFVLQDISTEEYKRRWPDGSGVSVGADRENNAYFNKREFITVGEYFYIKKVKRTLIMMSNGAVYEDNDDYKTVSDELAAAGITERNRRERARNVCCVRHFDGGDWLDDERETVFSYIPIVPTIANFDVLESKVIYSGIVRRLLDQQRVLNYSMSREIEEGALAPRAKYWVTQAQAAGFEDTLATLNTNSDPVQFYNPDPMAPGSPQQNGGAQINPGLRTISETMRQMMGQTAGMFAASMGDNPGLQSGIAIERLQNKGDNGTIAYFKAQEIAIRHTARIIVDAIPRVYDSERQIRILKEDGSFDMVWLNQTVIDQQTGRPVTLNDLSVGQYDVICSSGPSFKNRQEEMVAALVEIANVDPTVIQLGGDILLHNISAPGMDKIAERKRQQLFASGVIPVEQMTDEEKQQYAQQQQNAQQQQDPAAILAQAEVMKAQAEMVSAQTKQAEAQFNAQINQQKQQIEMAKLQQSGQRDYMSASQKQQQIDLDMQKKQQDLLLAMQEQQRKNDETMAKMHKMQAETLNIIREAMGASAVASPVVVQAYNDTALELIDKDNG